MIAIDVDVTMSFLKLLKCSVECLYYMYENIACIYMYKHNELAGGMKVVIHLLSVLTNKMEK